MIDDRDVLALTGGAFLLAVAAALAIGRMED